MTDEEVSAQRQAHTELRDKYAWHVFETRLDTVFGAMNFEKATRILGLESYLIADAMMSARNG